MTVQADSNFGSVDIDRAIARTIFNGFINGIDLTNPQGPERYEGYTVGLDALMHMGGSEYDSPPQTLGHLLDSNQRYAQDIYTKIFSPEESLFSSEEFLLRFCRGALESPSRFELFRTLDTPEAVSHIENSLLRYQIPLIDYLVLAGAYILNKGCEAGFIQKRDGVLTYYSVPLQ